MYRSVLEQGYVTFLQTSCAVEKIIFNHDHSNITFVDLKKDFITFNWKASDNIYAYLFL